MNETINRREPKSVEITSNKPETPSVPDKHVVTKVGDQYVCTSCKCPHPIVVTPKLVESGMVVVK